MKTGCSWLPSVFRAGSCSRRRWFRAMWSRSRAVGTRCHTWPSSLRRPAEWPPVAAAAGGGCQGRRRLDNELADACRRWSTVGCKTRRTRVHTAHRLHAPPCAHARLLTTDRVAGEAMQSAVRLFPRYFEPIRSLTLIFAHVWTMTIDGGDWS